MDRPRPQSDREAAIAALHHLLSAVGDAVTISVQTARGTLATFHLGPPTPQPQTLDDDERDCRADILTVLIEAARRMTTNQILSELSRRQWHHGERTVKGNLAEMVIDGDVDKDPRAHPPGYGPSQKQ